MNPAHIVPRLDDYWLYSKEHDRAWEDEQVDPRNFSATFVYRVCLRDAEFVVSPAWIADHQEPGAILEGRHKLILVEYNEHTIVAHLGRKLAACAAIDVGTVLTNLDVFGRRRDAIPCHPQLGHEEP